MTNKCNSVGRHLCLEATFWLSSQSLGESVVDVVKILCRLPSPPPPPPRPGKPRQSLEMGQTLTSLLDPYYCFYLFAGNSGKGRLKTTQVSS